MIDSIFNCLASCFSYIICADKKAQLALLRGTIHMTLFSFLFTPPMCLFTSAVFYAFVHLISFTSFLLFNVILSSIKKGKLSQVRSVGVYDPKLTVPLYRFITVPPKEDDLLSIGTPVKTGVQTLGDLTRVAPVTLKNPDTR